MTTTRTYDFLNRLLKISSQPTGSGEIPISYEYAYNDANQRTKVTYPDGSYWLYEYDLLGQLISGKRFWADGTPVAGQQHEYAFDDIGNRKTTKEGGDENGLGLRLASYSVNSLNQYTNRDVPGKLDILGIARADATVSVNGDSSVYRKGEYFWKELSVNNASAAVWQGITNVATLSGTSQTNTGNIFLPKTAESFKYDADGNLTNDGHWIWTWDGENRLIRLEGISGTPVGAFKKLEFIYDDQNRRVSKVVSNWTGSAYELETRKKFAYDGWNLVAELDANDSVTQSYLWGIDLSNSMQGAGGIGGLLAIKDVDTGAHFVAFDGNGNVCGLVSGRDGTTSGRYEYDPFGRTIRATGAAALTNCFRFSTKYVDKETGLCYYGHRYYDPGTGRWPNRDPIGEKGGLDLFCLSGNDAINGTDAIGLIRFPTEVTINRAGLLETQWGGYGDLGQPEDCASGSWDVGENSGRSEVTVRCVPPRIFGSGINCNSVGGGAQNQNGGQLRLYVEDAEPGNYRFHLSLRATVTVTSRPCACGAAAASANLLAHGMTTIGLQVPDRSTLSLSETAEPWIEVTIPSKTSRVLLADYNPTLRVTCSSTCSVKASASGYVSVIEYTDPWGNNIYEW